MNKHVIKEQNSIVFFFQKREAVFWYANEKLHDKEIS